MRIRNRFAFYLSMGLLAFLVYLVIDRCLFLRNAQRTTGEVIELSASNERCGTKRSRYDCTRFRAYVRYLVEERAFSLWVSAGSSRDHDQPTSLADYATGSPVPVVFNARRPGEAYRDGDVWFTPFLTLFVQISTLIGSFTDRRGSDD